MGHKVIDHGNFWAKFTHILLTPVRRNIAHDLQVPHSSDIVPREFQPRLNLLPLIKRVYQNTLHSMVPHGRTHGEELRRGVTKCGGVCWMILPQCLIDTF